MTDENLPETNPSEPTHTTSWKILIPLLLLAVFLGFLWVSMRKAYQGPVQIGEDFKDFTLTTFDGVSYNTGEQTGKVLLINFWSSWCKPCESEAAYLQESWNFYEPSGEVLFLGVDYVDTEPEAKKSLAKFQISYPNGPDLGTQISQLYRITGVPETFIVDKNGNLAHIQIGPFASTDEIKNLIDPLLATE
jgi:cytochrome c biogenesis protein CcmG, thiol:disulfide interchange protein DsbE